LLVGTLCAAETPPAFTRKPTATPSGNQVKIEFTVDRPTDVAVTVEDGQGKVLRHLAAGVLGKNPPEPLQPNTLAQGVTWDGKDDSGRPASGGPFRVRVRLGLKAEFDGFLMHNPDTSGEVSAVAVGPGGSLYVFHKDGTANDHMGGYKIKVAGRDGRHRKVLTPFPADIDPKRVQALGVFQTAEGDLVPHLYNWETLSFYPDNIGMRGRDMPEWSCPTVDSRGRVYWLVKGPSLVAVDPDGGIPYEPSSGLASWTASRTYGWPATCTGRNCRAWRSVQKTNTSTSQACPPARGRTSARTPGRCRASSACRWTGADRPRCSWASWISRARAWSCSRPRADWPSPTGCSTWPTREPIASWHSRRPTAPTWAN
jgi:hypothetical protein